MTQSLHTIEPCMLCADMNSGLIVSSPLHVNSNINPNFEDAWWSLGVVYQQHGQFHDAMGMYARALARNPDLPEVWLNVGFLYESIGQQIDAEKAFERSQAPTTHQDDHLLNQETGATHFRDDRTFEL